MIRISQENIEKYNLDFKAGLYKNDTEEAILYNEKLEAEKIANKTWQEKRVEAYNKNELTQIDNIVITLLEEALSKKTLSAKLKTIKTAREDIQNSIPKD